MRGKEVKGRKRRILGKYDSTEEKSKYDSTGEKNMKRIARGLSLLLVLACFGAVPAQARDHRFPTPFKHVVVIFQENRAPDNLFQGLCHPPFGHRH